MSCYIGDIGTVSSFQRREYEAFYWKIDEFSKLSENKNDYYCSPSFNFRGLSYYLRFYPNSMKGESGYLALHFHSPDNKESSCVHLTMGLKTRSRRIEKFYSRYITFYENSSHSASAIIQRAEFLKRKEELVPSDCLTFVAFLSPNALEIIRDIADQTETGHAVENGDKEKSEKKGVEKVACDMERLLTSGDRSDATIVVKETEFKVHSCILAARTPVFAALFEHDTLEKATRKITINDFEPAIFKEFLSYIYTGSVQNLTAENAFGLYRVADKYLIKDLKDVGRECIADSLSSETFCEALQLAMMCGDNDLLESATDYFATNTRLIIRSVQWQRYIEENPREANEILIKFFGPP